MENTQFCSNCGAKVEAGTVFCEQCGYKLESDDSREIVAKKIPVSEHSTQRPISETSSQRPMSDPFPQKAQKKGGKGGFIIVLILLLLIAGGYWFLSNRDDNKPSSDNQNINQEVERPNSEATDPATATNQIPTETAKIDYTKSDTYLSKPGLKATFYVNYPDGQAGVVERISGRASGTNEVVIVTEVEIVRDNGEDFGYGLHYVKRSDGSYLISDGVQFEIYPYLNDDLQVGKTWKYENDFGPVIWTVMDMGVTLDVGFDKFDNCLLLKEDNQAAGFESLTYYAPGKGMVSSMDLSGNNQYYKLTAIETISEAEAEAIVIKYCPNYLDIKDDRSQS